MRNGTLAFARARARARDLSPFLSLFLFRARALLGSVPAIIPGSRDYAQLPRGTFSRTTPAAATVELAPIWPPPVLSPALGSNARAKARSPTLGNTLDRAESRLSARLPRIMDATVTHVNEACHLHLLRLRLAPSLHVFDPLSDNTSATDPPRTL